MALANTAGWPEYNRRVLSAVVDRIARHPSDKVDWSMKVCGVNLLSLVAEHQLLSVLWPVLQSDVSYFADQTEPIRLTEEVWALDWATLGPEEQQCFNKDVARYIDADAATSRLWAACLGYPEPDYAAIDECVSAGADVMCRVLDKEPLLTIVLVRGPVKVVEAVLRTPRRIDFTIENSSFNTPLHRLAEGWLNGYEKTPEEVRRLLHLVLDRLEQHPNDVVDWGKKNQSGIEPISAAAACSHLATFVEVVLHERPVPYFHSDHRGKIRIGAWMCRPWDVNQLDPADRDRFDLMEDEVVPWNALIGP
eukprot:gene1056-biopygen858